MTKQIRVDEKVHRQVKKIADANFRGMGDQVAYWVAVDCSHPVEMREEKAAHVIDSDEALRFFYCRQCQRHIFYSDLGVAGVDQFSPSEKKKRSTA